MKPSLILAAGIAALCFTHSTQAADVTIRLTGSSAFRAATNNAIKNILSSGNPLMAYDSGASSFSGATYNTFIGTLPGVTGTVTVKTSWSGSVAGIRDVAAASSIKYLPDGVATSTGAGTAVAAPTSIQVEVSDIAMADNTQASTAFKTPSIQTVFKVGIVPFAFVAGKDTLPSVTNITFQQHRALLSNGTQPTSLFSNNPAETQPIYAAGRDPFSGTRLTTLAEDQYGTLNPVTQFKVLNFTSGNTVNQIDIYPATIPVPDAGNDGETSGGNVAKFMRYTTTNVDDVFNGYTGPASLIGYLGENDSYNAVWGIGNTLVGADQGNARYLAFNGVAGFGGQAKKGSGAVGITSGSPLVQLAAGATNDTTGLVVGQIMTGNGINPGSKIIAINQGGDPANSIRLDKNATATNAALTGWQIGALLPEQIRNGAYTFWNYEYIMWKTGTPGTNIVGTAGDKFTVATAIKNRVLTTDYGFSGLADDVSMKVKRDGDGSFVYPK